MLIYLRISLKKLKKFFWKNVVCITGNVMKTVRNVKRLKNQEKLQKSCQS